MQIFKDNRRPVKSKGFIGSILHYVPLDETYQANVRLFNSEKRNNIDSYRNPNAPGVIDKALKLADKIDIGIKSLEREVSLCPSYLQENSISNFQKSLSTINTLCEELEADIERLQPIKSIISNDKIEKIYSNTGKLQTTFEYLVKKTDSINIVNIIKRTDITNNVYVAFLGIQKIINLIDNLYKGVVNENISDQSVLNQPQAIGETTFYLKIIIMDMR